MQKIVVSCMTKSRSILAVRKCVVLLAKYRRVYLEINFSNRRCKKVLEHVTYVLPSRLFCERSETVQLRNFPKVNSFDKNWQK